MKIATWNVDSIRARLPRVSDWLAKSSPDAICLQEIKVEDDLFPRKAFEDLGYRVEVFGAKGRAGVAIASKEPLRSVKRGLDEEEVEDPAAPKRVIAAKLAAFDLVCVYVPNGQAVGSDEYFKKIAWLVKLREYMKDRYDPKKPLLVCGDWNVAPDDRDIWDGRLRGGLHCSKPERDALAGVVSWGFKDLLREKTEEPGHFTWWPYGIYPIKRNEGLRIDLMLATKPLAARLEALSVDKDERMREDERAKAADHAPVVATFRD
ncbi:exodeoxyribonuclease III [bacterium]|nr:exodeoxyribonuclease III [bacterium]